MKGITKKVRPIVVDILKNNRKINNVTINFLAAIRNTCCIILLFSIRFLLTRPYFLVGIVVAAALISALHIPSKREHKNQAYCLPTPKEN